jgi:glutathione-regulated potassium-efflux system ancillary protein KefG
VKKVLVVLCHPALENSRINRAWVDRARSLSGITVHDLYEVYQDFDINIRAEQKLLLQHDVIVLQHPLYWYSPPALMKQWFELTLEHGWAYGKGGEALQGKPLLQAISTGGDVDAYSSEGFHGSTLAEFLLPCRRTATLCGMDYLPPFVAHGAFTMDERETAHSADDYTMLLESLRDETIDLDVARLKPRLSTSDAQIFKERAV